MFFQLFCASLIAAAVSVPAGVYVGKNGEVGASWGGYSASAGLGGIVGGAGTRGGLHAEAGTPDGHFAAAGLGGSVGEGGNKGVIYSVAKKPTVTHSHASASSVSSSVASSGATGGSDGHVQVVTTVNKRPHVHGQTFFDDIFNIPISVLGAVNKYLNNNVRKGVHVHGTHVTTVDGGAGHVTTTVVKPVAASGSHASASASAVSSASSSASSSSNGNTNYVVDNNIYATPVKQNTKYDDIFNIPVSVLGAVNRLLNNGKK